MVLFLHERQSAWLQGLERAFRHFGGTPREVLVDNARALVGEHDERTNTVAFNDRCHAFCRYWGVTPRTSSPYRARTKGKDERGVADEGVLGITAEPPIERFERDERRTLLAQPPLQDFTDLIPAASKVSAILARCGMRCP